MKIGDLNGAMPVKRAVPLVLLPGTLCDSRVFAPILALLGDCPAEVYSLCGARHVSDAARQILSKAPPRFALLGFSLGGIVALEIAAMAPDRIVGLALIASNARAVATDLHAARRDDAALGAQDLDRYIRNVMWPRYVSPNRQNDLTLQDCITAMAFDGGAGALMDQTEIGLSRIDSRSRLGAISCPSLVLGGADDALCTPKMQHEMAELLPDAKLAMLPSAGHFLLLEQPTVAASHIVKWLARIST